MVINCFSAFRFSRNAYTLGNGVAQTFRAHLDFQDPFQWATDTDPKPQNRAGKIIYEYDACGGWASNKKAMQDLKKYLQLGLAIICIEVVGTPKSHCQRAIQCRARYARYKKSGVSIQTAKPVAA